MCMQEGENLNKNRRGNNHKFTYKPKEMRIRTKEMYLKQVNDSLVQKNALKE